MGLKKHFYILGVFLFLQSDLASAAVKCSWLHSRPKEVDLTNQFYWTQPRETSEMTAEQVRRLNEQWVKDLENQIPDINRGPREQRTGTITLKDASAVVNAIRTNPVANPSKTHLYEESGQGIGYCFGRATFAHLLLLRMGVRKDSVKKIWAVGPMKAFGNDWGFHVATVVHTVEKGWVTVDTNSYQVQTVREWVDQYSKFSVDGKLRFYFTPADRFGVYPFKYSREQLGLDRTKEEDFYKNYFVELMDTLRGKTVEDLGLRQLAKEPGVEGAVLVAPIEPVSRWKTLKQIIIDFFKSNDN